jgi:hypothetical protein
MVSLPSGMEYSYTSPAPLPVPTPSNPIPSTVEGHPDSRRPRKRDPSSAFDPSSDPLPPSLDPALALSSTAPGGDSSASSRIHKIRIVEKFLTHNPLQPSSCPPLPSPLSPATHPILTVNLSTDSATDDDWLDDKSLSLLSSSDLEKLMDRYLFNVVNQLVQLAISDDDLKAELDHLDSR